MFAPAIAFLDLETTGTSAAGNRITEVGVVRVEDGARVTEWSTLVNPECSIPPDVQALTGISNAMVASASTFGEIVDRLRSELDGCILVAHNARFDYGFLKHEFARLGRRFTAKVLCTVKLSRRLYPEAARHNLDSVIERHGLAAAGRHRALGDARILWEFVQDLYRRKSEAEIEAAIARILKTPSLPPQLPANALDEIPEAPGVYRFYGMNALPLYIGKSVDLRSRVAAHFSSDYRSPGDFRLSSEITRIEFEETAGELGALLRESQLIKTLLPVYNHRLRRRLDMVAFALAEEPALPDYVHSDAIDPSQLQDFYGPFSTKRQAREVLRELAGEEGLCWRALGLERREGPCFARQVKKCAGACVGAESPVAHHARLREALKPLALQSWPYPGMVALREASLTGDRVDVHVFRDWCWLGTVSDEAALQMLIEQSPRGQFDLDIYRLLVRHLGGVGRGNILKLQ